MADVDLWLLAGQSNAQGNPPGKPAPGFNIWGWEAAPTNRFPSQALEWESGFGVIPLADGRETGWTGVKYKAIPGSAWPAFFNYYCRYTTNKQVLVRGAIGGTSVLYENTNPQNGDWDTNNPTVDRRRFTALIGRAASAISAIQISDTIVSVNVLWHGGERDALIGNGLGTPLGNTANSQFFTEFKDLLPRFRTAMTPLLGSTLANDLKMYVALIGEPDFAATGSQYTAYEPELDAVRAFQDQACTDVDGMDAAYRDCVNFPGWGLMSQKDYIHYSQPGYNRMGEGMANYITLDQGLTELIPVGPTVIVSPLPNRLKELDPDYPPPLPRTFATPGTFLWEVPAGVTSLTMDCEGAGGGGGHGQALIKGGAGGGGAYSQAPAVAVTPGEMLEIIVGAPGAAGASSAGADDGQAGGFSQVKRVSDGTILCKAMGGGGGDTGNPAIDGAGGAAASGVGTTKTSGQNGGVSGVDNGGNGAAPLGGAGGAGPGPNDGVAPGGGGAGAAAGGTNFGGNGARGVVILS